MAPLSHHDELRAAARQQQFLTVIDRDEATRRFHEHLNLAPLGVETIGLAEALNRALATDVVADIDVPSFDRSNVDGFAVQAADSFELSVQLAMKFGPIASMGRVDQRFLVGEVLIQGADRHTGAFGHPVGRDPAKSLLFNNANSRRHHCLDSDSGAILFW